MTAADRLRAAVEAALPCTCDLAVDPHCARQHCETVLAAVQPIVEEREAEIARLRAVLEWAATILPRPCCVSCGQNARNVMGAAVDGDWPAVRAAGVVLPGEE